MSGTVTQVNPGRAMVAVRTDNADYSVFEVIGGEEFEIGDNVSWREDTPLGGHQVVNRRTGERADVYFQNHYMSAQQVLQQLR
jgi:hypothetical protein